MPVFVFKGIWNRRFSSIFIFLNHAIENKNYETKNQ